MHVRRIATVRLRTPTLASGAVVLGDRASAGVLAVITCYHDLDHAAAVPAVDPPLDRTRRGATGPQRVAGEVKAGQYARTVPEKGTAMGPASECGAVWLGPHPPSGVRTATATSRRAPIDQRPSYSVSWHSAPKFNVPTV